VDDFGIETYESSSQVRTYWAELSFLQDDNLMRKGRISVNNPLSINGLGFYTWRYGDDVQAAIVRLQLIDSKYNAVTAELELQVGETMAVPGTELWLTALRFYRTFALTDDGQPTDLGNVPGGDSAVLLQITGIDETGTTVAYRDLALPFVAKTDVVLPQTFILVDAFVPAFLEIHYVRNPGYPVVWWGFVLVMIGLAGAFYFTPSQIRIEIHPDHVLLRAEDRNATHRSAKRLEEIAAAIRLHCNEKEG
jgi:cytochrome c biogenesis protein ResB